MGEILIGTCSRTDGAPVRSGRFYHPRVNTPSLKLSPTAVASFLQCPRQYKFRYVDRLGDQYGGPRPYFTMGNHVHDTLRDFLIAVPPDQRTLETVVKLLKKNWRRYRLGFRGEEDERRWGEKALKQLSYFISSHDVQVKPYMVEAWFEVKITPGLVLQSRIDRVDLQDDGTLHIIDYKTGNTPEASNWTQLYLNALVLSRNTRYPISRASFIYLSSGSVDTVTVNETVLDQARWELLLTAQAIGREKRFRPQPGAGCRRCDFKPICPAKEDSGKIKDDHVQIQQGIASEGCAQMELIFLP